MADHSNLSPDGLREWRGARALSQQQLADLLDVDKMTISRWERGARTIPSYLRLALRSLRNPVKQKH